ncbi:MAG: hypothetical protein FWC00_01785 [Firmicutes bacterium]|nr:hypothetical protein [Bacillota bacterium]
MDKPKRNRNRAVRFAFTLSNPFVTDNVNIVNMDELTAEQQGYARTHHDFSFHKLPENEKFFLFHHCQYEKRLVKDDPTSAIPVIGERIFFKDYKSAQEYFKTIEYIDYFCFQYERGEKTGLLHLQGFLHFKRPMDMKVVHKLFPTWHLHKCEGSNYDCVAYCNKPKTRVEGYDFFSWGDLVEEGQRKLDQTKLKSYIKDRTPYEQILEDNSWHAVMNGTKIIDAQQLYLQSVWKNVVRNVHVVYIYGKEGAGKTSYYERVLGCQPQDAHIIGEYDTDFRKGMFDEYNAHDILIFDEFDSSVDITKMNTWLNGRPCSLTARGKNKTATFTKVFIISNYPIDHHWRKQRQDPENSKEPSYRGFLRRVNEIIYMPDQNIYEWQKGKPSDEIIAALEKQGAEVKISEVQS